jgi:hypothetical protein
VDQRVAQRRPTALRSLEQLDAPLDTSATALVGPSFDSLRPFITALFDACGRVAAGGDGAEDDLQRVVDLLREARADSQGAQRLRPWIEAWRTFDRVVDALDALCRVVLEAMAAETQIVGKQLERRVQPALDEATLEMHDLNVRIDRAERLANAGNDTDIATELLREAAFAAGGDLLTLEAAGQAMFAELVGGDAPDGFGVAIAVTTLQVDALFDPTRFWRLVREVAESCAPGMREARSGDWDVTFGDAEERLRAAVNSFVALANALETSGEQIRAAMTLAADLVEGPGRRLVSTALAARGIRPLTDKNARKAGEVLRAARDAGLGDWLAGFDLAVRNSRAHDSYKIEGDAIVLSNGERRSTAELSDVLLAGIESVLGIHLGLVVAGTRAGIDVGLDASMSALFPDAPRAVAAMCAAMSWDGVQVTATDDVLEVHAVTDLPIRISQVGAIVAPIRDPDIKVLRLSVSSRGGPRTVLEGPIAPLRDFSAATSDLAKQAALQVAARTWTKNGEHLLPLRYVHKWVAMAFSATLGESPKQQARTLQLLRELAGRIDDPDLLRHIRNGQAMLRNLALGLEPSDEQQGSLDFFAEWEKRRLPPIDF